MRNDTRGAKVRAEMRQKGYLQAKELAEKLTVETGRNVTAAAVKSWRTRKRIQGVYHEGSNTWFYAADTNLPEGAAKRQKPKPKTPTEPEPVVLGPWARWPAPKGGSKSLGWLGGIV